MDKRYPLQVEIETFLAEQSRTLRYSHDWLRVVTWTVNVAWRLFIALGAVALCYLMISISTYPNEGQNSIDGLVFSGCLAVVCVLLAVYALRIHRVFFARLKVSDRFLIFLDEMIDRKLESAYQSALGIVSVASGARDLGTRRAFSMAVLILVDSFDFAFKDEYLAEAVKNLSLLEAFSQGNRFVYWGMTRLLIAQGRFVDAGHYLARYRGEFAAVDEDPHYESLEAMILAGEAEGKGKPH